MSETTRMIPMDQINADHEFNCRGPISALDVADLAKDISKNGLLQPILVTEYEEPVDGKRYRLIGGFRRYTAMQVNGSNQVWANVLQHLDEYNARYTNLRENLQRENLSIMQEANSIRPLYLAGHTEERIKEELGMTRGWVQVRVLLLKLPSEVQTEVAAGIIKQTEIRDLYTIYKKLGKDRCLEATKELKEVKLKGGSGSKVINSVKKKITGDAKRMRAKGEIIEMQDRVRSMIGNGLPTRLLAWVAGEISDNEFEHTMKEYCDHNGKIYAAPID